VEVAMLDRADTGAVLGSEAVDAEFWALVCSDEEWLQAEFDTIISGPAETPARPWVRLVVAGDRCAWRRGLVGNPDAVRRPGFGIRTGPARRRERSPPLGRAHPAVDSRPRNEVRTPEGLVM
jgi:hypothetical protein